VVTSIGKRKKGGDDLLLVGMTTPDFEKEGKRTLMKRKL
jgi:hypothetical protein